ncbi:thioredoxin family protein [Streptomyces sp. NPDC093225]|uniref:thioredoxin family protein n=1 Tax=Streptomyces sp. NPDC093225 TaxID=3366034 RepID=UPI0038221C2D
MSSRTPGSSALPKRTLPLLLTAGFAVTALTGCGGSDSADAANNAGAVVAESSSRAADAATGADAAAAPVGSEAAPAASEKASTAPAAAASVPARPAAKPAASVAPAAPKPAPKPRRTSAPDPKPTSGGGGGAPERGYPSGNGDKAVAAALKAAKADGKAVLLDFGANWCGNCKAADKAFATSSLTGILNDSYHLVKVDIGSSNSDNFSLLRKYSSGGGSYKMPVLIVVSPSGDVRTDTHATGNPKLTVAGLSTFLRAWAK